MTILEKSLLIIVLLLVIFGIGTYVVYRYRRRYTRERFAFFATGTIFTLFATVVVPTLTGESFLTVLVRIINHYFGLKLPLGEVDAVTQTIVTSLFILLLVFVFVIHRNWDGAISIYQYETEKLGKKVDYSKILPHK